jgi:hypothetical protein
MPFSYALGRTRTSAAGNPTTFSYTVAVGDSVVVVMLNTQSATNRAGGALTWGSTTLTQANSTQKAAASPEASAEMWYMLNPTPGTQTLTIPNSNGATIFTTVVIGRAPSNLRVYLDGSNGANNTAANPSPGAIETGEDGDIIFSIVASGAQAWGPSGQTGTIIANTDDGATGGGEQYTIQATHGTHTASWTNGSDDWGAVVAAFAAVPPLRLQNYMSVDAQSGIWVGEKIR